MERKKLLRTAEEAARHHMSLFVLLTLVNFLLIKTGVELFVPPSAVFPQFLMAYGYARGAGVEWAVPAADLISYLCLALFVHCVIFSYRERRWLLCGAALTAADTAFIIYLLISYGSRGLAAEIYFNIWIIIALCAGYLAPKFIGGGGADNPISIVCADNDAGNCGDTGDAEQSAKAGTTPESRQYGH